MNLPPVRGPRIKRLMMITPSDPSLIKEEEAFAKKYFDEYDTEGKGSIELEELPSLLRRMNIYMNKQRLDKYYRVFFGRELDTADPVLQWDRFKIFFEMIMRNQTAIYRARLVNPDRPIDYVALATRALDDAQDIFNEFDSNMNCALDSTELKELFECLGLDDRHGDGFQTFLKTQFLDIDKDSVRYNQDGRVDFYEFVGFYNNLIDLMETIG